MRFLARLNFFKYFPEGHKKQRSDIKNFNYLSGNVSANKILDELHLKGLSSNLVASEKIVCELMNIAVSSEFVARGSKVKNLEHKYKIKFPDNKPERPDDFNLYSLMNVHNDSNLIQDFIKKDLLPIANAYLGKKPYIANTQIWISFNDKNDKNPDYGFHYDIDDYRFLKYFMYLSEVDERSGPHEVIEGTHKGNDLYKFFNRRLSDSSTIHKKNPHKTIVGKIGDSFFEDTFCYHRGKNPIKPRIIFGVVFRTNKYED